MFVHLPILLAGLVSHFSAGKACMRECLGIDFDLSQNQSFSRAAGAQC